MKNYDVIIIGAGPAGISAGLYAKRANLDVLILYYGESELQKANIIENYYGFEDGVKGEDLYSIGINQAKKLGIEVLKKEILSIEINENMQFETKTIDEAFKSKAIIISTGNKKAKPNIEGIENFEGKGISYCAICDGFFYKNKNVAVIGNGNYAIHEAEDLVNIVNDVKILSNGDECVENRSYEIDDRKIKQIIGNKKVSAIEFEDGEKIPIDGVFIAQGIAGGNDFAKKLGVILKNDNIVVNENMETNIKGIFACGNVTGGLLQVSKAVYEGSKAGIAVSNYIKNLKKESV